MIEAAARSRSDLFLNQAGRGRERHVGRDGRRQDEIDLLGEIFACCNFIRCCFRGDGADIGREFVVRGDAAFLDAGAVVIHSSVVSTMRERSAFSEPFRHVTSRADD